MAKSKAVWGIDVGHCALKALKLVINDDGDVEVLAEDYIEHAKILSQADADPRELISKSLEKFLSRNDITEDLVAVGVPGQHTLARFSKLPPVDPKKVPDIVQFEANQQIPFDMDEVIWDYQTFIEEDSPEIEVGIFAMKRDLIHEHLAHFSDVGIEPMLMQSGPLAVHDAVLFDGQCSDETTVVVDIGAENTDLVVTDKVRIWTRTIPIGGNSFTEALANGFKLSFAKAENLKRQASSSKYARQIFQAMRPIFVDLVGEIQRSIGFYTSTHRSAKLDRMVGMGDAFRLPGLQKYLQQNLGMKVIRPSKFKNLKSAPDYSRDHEDHVLSFGVAYGLALDGLGKGHMRCNLLPPEIARQVTWRKKKPWFAAAAACLALCAGMVWFRQSADLRALAGNRGGAEQLSSMTFSAAVGVFNNPPSSGTPPREYAKTIKLMTDSISKKYEEYKRLGKTEMDQCEIIIELQRDKALWPMILSVIHDSVPSLPQLTSAGSGAAYVQAIMSDPDGLARSQRQEVLINSFDTQFVDDVFAFDYRSAEAADEDPEELFEYFEADWAQGFIVTLYCRTPYIDRGKFIEGQNGFLQTLKAKGHVLGQGFFLDGVRLMTQSGAGPASGGSRSTGQRGRGRGGMPVGRSSSGSVSRRKGKLDPLTFEDASEDWSFSVKFVVALEDLPEEKTPGTPQEKTKKSRKPPRRSGGGRGREGGRG